MPEKQNFIESSPYSAEAADYLAALVRCDGAKAGEIVDRLTASGTSPHDIYLYIFQPVQYEVGRLWETNQVSFLQEHYGTATTQMLMTRLHPRIFSAPRVGRSALIAGVSGGLHELGPRMVADFFEMEGWDSHFAGGALTGEAIAEAARGQRPDVVCISCTMLHHLPGLEKAVTAVKAEAPGVKVLVGGRPFNTGAATWQTIGADGGAADGAAAVRLAWELVRAPA